MSFKSNIITGSIVGAVLATTVLFAGSAHAYNPYDSDKQIGAYLELQVPATSPSQPMAAPLPLEIPVFLRSVGAPRFRIETGSTTSAPLGFQIFCIQNAQECLADESVPVGFTPKMLAKISLINLAVNDTMIARNDVGIDQWVLNAAEGDCEDFVLTKRFQLASAGLPVGALRIATARTPEGIGHAVLVVRTDQGDLVLDNLNNQVKSWNEVDLEMVSISGANPSEWFTIG